jgi:hypothetical protein
MYGLGVGISMVFDILGYFLFQWGWDHSEWPWPTYHQMSPDTRIKDMYGLGVGRVFEIFEHFLFKGGQEYSIWS